MTQTRAERNAYMRNRYRLKHGTKRRSLESISLPGEIWKPSVIDGKTHLWYSVSNQGRVASHFSSKQGPGGRGGTRQYDPEYCTLLKPAISYKNNHDPSKRDVYGNSLKVGQKIIQCTRVSFRLPWDFFKDIDMYGSEYQYPVMGLHGSGNGKCCQRTMSVHKLVANVHMSVDENPPERIADVYHDLPESVKQWVRETVVINHIDHDPTNNLVTNLEYVTPRENCHKAIEQYGGHFCPDQYLKHKKPVEQEPELEPKYDNALAELLGV